MNTQRYLPAFHATVVWDNYRIDWNGINPDVNIVVGVNGSGKTTLLRRIFSYCNNLEKQGKALSEAVIFVESVDNIALRDKRKKDNALTQELKEYIHKSDSELTLSRYRSKLLDVPTHQAALIAERLDGLFKILNQLFERTHKTFNFEDGNFTCKKDGSVIEIDNLSSGEKYILLLILRVFLLEEKSAIILLDEPENTMHISWQRILVDILIILNPNAQYIISTHSPSLFGAGWGDKVVYVEQIISKENA